MALQLAPNENVFYPMPYVETEPNLLVITNQRIVNFGDEGKQELPAKQIQFVGRMSLRPLAIFGVILALAGLPLLGVGAYFIYTSGAIPVKLPIPGAAAPPAAGDDPAAAPAEGESGEGDDPAGAAAAPTSGSGVSHKLLGFIMTPVGLILLLLGALMTRLQRHYVLVRGEATAIQIRTKNTIEQTQILATVGALQSANKGAAAPTKPAAAPAPIKVDDKGDPVKALQELAAARSAGKVGEEEFQAKREILLERIKARK